MKTDHSLDAEPLPQAEPDLPPTQGPDGAWRRTAFGQIAEPLVPPHPEPPEAPEDELTQAALADPHGTIRDMPNTHPTFWRLVFLIVLCVGALAFVFWR